MQDLITKILDEVRGSWRFRWIGLAAAWLFCVAGWAWVFTKPNMFEAKARVYVDSQTVLGPLLRGLALDPNVESELSVVRQALLSRPNLEAVARKTDLDAGAVTPEKREALLNSLQQRISVSTETRSRGIDGMYAINFRDQQRDKALAVVEMLLNTFVEDTLGSKRTGQESAQRFLDDEIAELERRLTSAETRLSDFKKRNVGKMPDDRGDYFARLQAELVGLAEVRRSAGLAESRRMEIDRQLSGEEPFLFGFDAPAAQTDAKTGDLTFRIQETEARLAELLLRYTDKHPQVVALRGTIDELKAREAAELARVRAGKGATGSLSSSLKSNPIYQGLQLELKRTEVQLAELRQDLAQRSARVGELQGLVNTVPEVEAELARLNRDYEITRTRYSELVERRETAKLSESAEKQGVIKFKIIDPPTAGLQPVAPKRKLFILAVLVAAVGVACGVMYLLNQLSSVYYNARTLAEKTGLPVLGAVARTWSQPQRLEARRSLLMFSGAASLLIVTCLLVVLWSDAGVRAAQRILASV